MIKDKKEAKHIRAVYKLKNKIKKAIVKYLIFLVLFFLMFYLILNLGNISKKVHYNLEKLSYKLYLLMKGTEKTKPEDSKPVGTESQAQNKEEAKASMDKSLDKAHSDLVHLYKQKYGKDYEKYFKRDMTKKIFSSYYSKYGKAADLHLRDDFYLYKPEVKK